MYFKITLNKKYKLDKVGGTKLGIMKKTKTLIIEDLKKRLEIKNIETKLHTDRVSNYCIEMAKELGLSDEMIKKAGRVGTLHDIGKIAISDKILLKPGKLTEYEYEIMKTHSQEGYKLACLIPEIKDIANEILAHHERWDGNGYPMGLRDKEIPILSRIVSIADSFDAMTENRCYSKARTIEEGILELKRCSGTQFDPDLVNIFINKIILKNNIIDEKKI